MTIHRDVVQDYIFSTLQISNDIYRNSADSDFVKSGGEIIYCFDATVFNLFYNTSSWRNATSSFHSRYRQQNQNWSTIEAQSTLIAAEYLLSEQLPGASNGSVYLSPWHLTELTSTLEKITSGFLQRLTSDSSYREKIVEETRRKLGVAALFRGNAVSQNRFGSNQLHDDMFAISQFVGSDSEKLRRFALTRHAAEVLVNCPETERMDQIRRIVSQPLRDRLKPLHTLLPIDGEGVSVSLYKDAVRWYSRLDQEMRVSSHRSKRTEQAKWNDAQTVALVRWVARQIPAHQRIVFVTGDDVLFNTYRRWWVDVAGQTDQLDEPFVMRRTFQYAPIFNLSDARNDVSVSHNVEQLFEEIQGAVETSLLPFNLSSMANENKRPLPGSIMRGREFLALRARDSRTIYHRRDEDPIMTFFLSNMGDAWFADQARKIGVIKDLFRRIERIGIGLFYEIVSRRLADDVFLTGISITDLENPERRDEVLEFLSRSLDALSTKVRSAWLPVAVDFLREYATRDHTSVERRVPDTLFFTIAEKNIYDLMENPQEHAPPREVDWDTKSESAFILAAVVAMKMREWWKAEEFASQAVVAASRSTSDQLVLSEVRFLYAQTKRFRFGAFVAPTIDKVDDVSRQSAIADRKMKIWSEADTILARLEAEFGTAPHGDVRRLHWWRARSEHQALRIFTIVSKLQDPGAFEPSSLLIIKEELDDILIALHSCALIETDIQAQHPKAAKAIFDQIYHNIAAAHAAQFITFPSFDFQISQIFSDMIPSILKYTEGEIHKSIKFQALFFRVMVGAQASWDEFSYELERESDGELEIDKMFRSMVCGQKEALYDIFNMRCLGKYLS